MILVDTSIWIDHLRTANKELQRLLHAELVLSHSFVIGELALGQLPQRRVFLADLQDLPRAMMASDAEVLRFIDDNDLSGLGIGYIDAHLLAAARLTNRASIWTRDKRVMKVAERLNLAAILPQ